MRRREFMHSMATALVPLFGESRLRRDVGTMRSDKAYDVAVIGSGVFGAWTAYSLSQLGKKVVLVDAYGPGNSRASSGGESRVIRMGYGGDELYSRWSLGALERWQRFCREFDRPDLFADSSLATNEARVEARHRLIPELAALFKALRADEIERRCLGANLPFSLIARPEDLFDDVHLNATGGLADIRLPDGERAGQSVRTTLFPITMSRRSIDFSFTMRA